ncbi:FAD-binding domain-containing protein [Camillea tinctor]|nr:FAD-binding domain-containing protein [Camillea tinctor]
MLAVWLLQPLVALLVLPYNSWALVDPQSVHDDLESLLSPGAEVALRSNSTYAEDFTPRYNIATQPSYIVGVKPALVGDVQKVVIYAVERNISFLATGGGHGYSTSLGRFKGGIDMDLGKFNSIQVDSLAKTMTIGGAVRANEVATALQAVGMEIPVPQCPCIGFAGATLGGGIGPYSGLYGAISDSLISVELITAEGQVLNVSQTEYADLLYGIKGAGSNYGVVLSLKYRIYPATNDGYAMNADMTFLGSQNGSVWALIKQFSVSQPRELSIGISIRYSPDPTLEGVIITANFIYAGPQAEGKALIQPFINLKPLNVNISTVPWNYIPATANDGAIVEYGCSPGVYYVPYGVNLYQVDIPNLVSSVGYMDRAMATNPELRGASIVWQQYAHYGFQLYSQDTSAFPFRDVIAFVQVDGVGSSASQGLALTQFGREMRDMLQNGSGRDELSVFVHFGHGDEDPAAWFSRDNLPRLMSLKNVYDPLGIFSWYNPVKRY